MKKMLGRAIVLAACCIIYIYSGIAVTIIIIILVVAIAVSVTMALKASDRPANLCVSAVGSTTATTNVLSPSSSWSPTQRRDL